MKNKLSKPSWLLKYKTQTLLIPIFKKYATGNLIDVGCGTKPYKKDLYPYVNQHLGIDHEGCIHNKHNIDIMCDIYNIPVSDCNYDTVLATEVIEHLEEPNNFLAEINRILKNDCFFILTVPFIYHLHEEPRDFYRYTRNGIKYLAQKNNF